MNLLRNCCALCLAASSMAVQAEVQRFESPVERVTVVELFTSHGCSSCPPADDWLRGLSQAPGLWSRLIPLAFHVDYWDYLGWRDRFASAGFSERQREYRHNGALGAVYTPGVLVNGKEWRGWYWGQALPEASPMRIGRLQLEVAPENPATLRFTPDPEWDSDSLQAHLAILGCDLKSPIGGGENSGRTLTESFVVLAHRAASTPVSSHVWQLAWPAFDPIPQARYAVVAWLSRGDDPSPLQAVGGWLELSES
ncbi:MAG: DUF1223 domain-containing protein [Candidatus Thiodiazotropha sp.]